MQISCNIINATIHNSKVCKVCETGILASVDLHQISVSRSRATSRDDRTNFKLKVNHDAVQASHRYCCQPSFVGLLELFADATDAVEAEKGSSIFIEIINITFLLFQIIAWHVRTLSSCFG